MGCVESSACHMQESSLCHVPTTFATPPPVLPPDHRMHELYVCKLNAYLMLVASNPQAFQDKVEMRRARLGTYPGRKPALLTQLHTADDAEWVTVFL
mmetsp:Transcript_36090/g.84403  ORF Transcript_36090/g.84403 Transcript_36090/m.84403 type:complete len:97 (-) Transcript_36090:493-783(-)